MKDEKPQENQVGLWYVIKIYTVYLSMLMALCGAFTVSLCILIFLNGSLGWNISILRPLISGFDGMSESLEFVSLLGISAGSFVFVISLAILSAKKILHFTWPWIVAGMLQAIAATMSAHSMATTVMYRDYEGYHDAIYVGGGSPVWLHVAVMAVPITIGFIYRLFVWLIRRTDNKQETHRKRIMAVIIAAELLTIGVMAVAIPASTTDGTESYSGVELEAAREALEFDKSSYSPALFRNWNKAHVERVVPSLQGIDSHGKPLRCTDNPNEIQYYSVLIRRVWLFGTTYAQTTYRLCNVTG